MSSCSSQNLIFVEAHDKCQFSVITAPLGGHMFDYDLEAFHDHSVVQCWECSFLGLGKIFIDRSLNGLFLDLSIKEYPKILWMTCLY